MIFRWININLAVKVSFKIDMGMDNHVTGKSLSKISLFIAILTFYHSNRIKR